MEKEELTKAMQTAIQAEKEGLEHYLKFARLTKDETGKNMFISLARDEWEHMTLLEKILDELQTSGRAPAFELVPSQIPQTFPKPDERKLGQKGETPERNALKIGIELEQKAKEYYLELAGRTDDIALQGLFERLAKIEDSHYVLLAAQLDHIDKAGFWFDVQEFRLEAG